MIWQWVTILLVTTPTVLWAQGRVNRTGTRRLARIPRGFKFGAASSAYQIEGAWNVSDKGESVWDSFVHEIPSRIIDNSTGDIAADSYHNYEKDVGMLKGLGADFYRFSLSWTRILPTGFPDKISHDGIRYYTNLLDKLDDEGIEPIVTIYHWDHPANLEDMGGWTNEMMVTWFADYARVVFQLFGDRVKIFSTINEPAINCVHGLSFGTKAPGKKNNPTVAPYLCMHNMLKAHAKAYRIYDSEFRPSQDGQIGIVIPCQYFYSKDPNDTVSGDVLNAFDWGWTAHPIFSETGDYPAAMKQRIAEKSRLEGYPRSRLPEFTEAEIEEIRGTADYFGLNHYFTKLVEPVEASEYSKPSRTVIDDSGMKTSYDPSWPRLSASPWIRPMPQGFGDLLRKLKTLYDNPPVYVLENGVADDGSSLNDTHRIFYMHDYLRELFIAVNRDGCDVEMYAVWSLIDNMEWDSGYVDHFGIVSIDFDDPTRQRTPKLSYRWYRELIRSRKLPPIDCCLSDDDDDDDNDDDDDDDDNHP